MPSLGIARKRNIPLLFVIFAVNEFSFVYIWISIISDVGMISILYLIESENKINIQKLRYCQQLQAQHFRRYEWLSRAENYIFKQFSISKSHIHKIIRPNQNNSQFQTVTFHEKTFAYQIIIIKQNPKYCRIFFFFFFASQVGNYNLQFFMPRSHVHLRDCAIFI